MSLAVVGTKTEIKGKTTCLRYQQVIYSAKVQNIHGFHLLKEIFLSLESEFSCEFSRISLILS